VKEASMRSNHPIAWGTLTILAATAVAACSASNGTGSPVDAGGGDSGVNASLPDGGMDTLGPQPKPIFLAHFDKAQGQLPEGIWAQGGTPTVGWAPLATLLDVAPDGTTRPIGTAGSATNTFTLGIVAGPGGTIYFGVGAASAVGGAPASAQPTTPAPGVYSLAADGGTAQVFSLGSHASPPMNFANGLAVQGTAIFVADSEGAIYKLDATGQATTWSSDPLLAASQPACGGVVPLAVGANGIVVDIADVYITNTNYGRLIDIPIQPDGSAGAAKVVAESCGVLAGADGLVRDIDGSFLVAVNAQNRIVRVTATGSVSVVTQGSPLDTPASLFIDSTAQPRRLLITNSSFFSAADAGAPGVLSLPLP
jgi:hypothetical protein